MTAGYWRKAVPFISDRYGFYLRFFVSIVWQRKRYSYHRAFAFTRQEHHFALAHDLKPFAVFSGYQQKHTLNRTLLKIP